MDRAAAARLARAALPVVAILSFGLGIAATPSTKAATANGGNQRSRADALMCAWAAAAAADE